MNIQYIKKKLSFNTKNYLAMTIGLLVIISINSNSSHLKIFNDFVKKNPNFNKENSEEYFDFAYWEHLEPVYLKSKNLSF